MELLRKADLRTLPPSEQVEYLEDAALSSFDFLASYQQSNGLIPASLGRFDDEHFNGTAWSRDLAEVAMLGVDHYLTRYLPQIALRAETLSLNVMRGTLNLYGRGEAWERLKTRPYLQENGYYTIEDETAAPVKWYLDGSIVTEWGHHQPDAIARVIKVAFLMIKSGLPLLDEMTTESRPMGEVLQALVGYQSNLRLGYHQCRAMWEHGKGETAISTIYKYTDSSIEAFKGWSIIEQDSRKRGYNLTTSRSEIAKGVYDALAYGRRKAPHDFTDPYCHPEPEDAAQLTVASETNPPLHERERVVQQTSKLERHHGLIRFEGDPWKKGKGEAPWFLPLLYMIQQKSIIAMEYLAKNSRATAKTYLDGALIDINKAEKIISDVGYPPELHYQQDDGEEKANNNDLVWIRTLLVRSYPTTIGAIDTLQRAA